MNQLSTKYTIHIQGEYSGEFLQGQLTCNIDAIQSNQWSLFAYCNRLGKVIATGYIHCHNKQSWSIIVDRQIKDLVIQKLTPIAMLSSVTISNKYIAVASTTTINASSIQIPHSNYFLSLILTTSTPTSNNIEQEFAYHELLCNIPTISSNNTNKFTPNSLKLEQIILQNTAGLSFNKGCYIGQEVVSKIHHKGLIKKAFFVAKTTQNHAIEPLQPIYQNTTQVGFIIQTLTTSNLIGCIIPIINQNQLYWQTATKQIPIELVS